MCVKLTRLGLPVRSTLKRLFTFSKSKKALAAAAAADEAPPAAELAGRSSRYSTGPAWEDPKDNVGSVIFKVGGERWPGHCAVPCLPSWWHSCGIDTPPGIAASTCPSVYVRHTTSYLRLGTLTAPWPCARLALWVTARDGATVTSF